MFDNFFCEDSNETINRIIDSLDSVVLNFLQEINSVQGVQIKIADFQTQVTTALFE